MAQNPIAQAEQDLRKACTDNKAVEAAAKRLQASSAASIDTSMEVARTARDSSPGVVLFPARKRSDVTNRFAAYRQKA